MTDRPLFQARRTPTGSHREVVDHNMTRVAFVPSHAFSPVVLDRRAGIIAAALMHDAISAETITVRDVPSERVVQVWDGGMLLADLGYVADEALPDTSERSHQLALDRAGALADGYLLARRLCLGERP